MQLSEKVLRVMQAEGITAAELAQMLNEVAFTSIRGCNRRYFQWLFRVQGDVLLDMQRVDLVEVGHGTNRMTEDHDACRGEGCRDCGWSGSISRAVNDPTERAMDAAS